MLSWPNKNPINIKQNTKYCHVKRCKLIRSPLFYFCYSHLLNKFVYSKKERVNNKMVFCHKETLQKKTDNLCQRVTYAKIVYRLNNLRKATKIGVQQILMKAQYSPVERILLAQLSQITQTNLPFSWSLLSSRFSQ